MNKKILWSLIGGVVLIATGYLIFHHSNSPVEFSGTNVTQENRDTATTSTSTSTAPVMQENPSNVRLPASEVYSKGIVTIHAPYAYDLDKGIKLSEENSSTGDFQWAHPTSMTFALQPLAGELHLVSRKAAFGKAKFDALTKDDLAKLHYSKNSIGMNDLDKGVIVAVKTNEGRYCKFILLDGELDFTISWVTYEQ